MNTQPLAEKAIELYEAIQKAAGLKEPVPPPFDTIYRVLMQYRFDLERLR